MGRNDENVLGVILPHSRAWCAHGPHPPPRIPLHGMLKIRACSSCNIGCLSHLFLFLFF